MAAEIKKNLLLLFRLRLGALVEKIREFISGEIYKDFGDFVC